MLGLISTILFFSLIAGLIKPSWFNKIFRKEMTRKLVLLFIGIPWFISIFFIPTTPSAEETKQEVSQNIVEERQEVKEEEIIEEDNQEEQSEEVENAEEKNEPEQNQEISQPEETQEPEEDNQVVSQTLYQVDRVVDGDTVRLFIDGVSQSVRLIGINSPESVHPQKDVECMGLEASQIAKEQLDGKKVILKFDPAVGERDKYDRLLGYIFLQDGTNFNKWMIQEGYAYEYTYNAVYQYQAEFKQAQKYAEENKKGLWADGVCEIQEEVVQEEPEEQTALVVTSNWICSKDEYNCKDFSTHNEAQSAYEYCMDQVGYDVHKLDRDNDGLVCENLP